MDQTFPLYDISGSEQPIQSRGKPGIDGYLNDDFHDLLLGCAHIHRAMNVDFELRSAIGHCRECRDRRQLSGL